MANFSPTPSCSGNNPPDHFVKNDLNGNSEPGQETREDTGAYGGLINGTGTTESHGGARPKVRRPLDLNGLVRPVAPANDDQKVPSLVLTSDTSPNLVDLDSDVEDNTNQDSDTNDDLYVYTYKGFGDPTSRDDYEADLPKSFFQLDVGSDSESGTTNQGGSGPGQSNLSNEVAAALLIQSEIASNRKQSRTQAVPASGRDSPDMDFLEMDFDPGESDDESGLPNKQNNNILQAESLQDHQSEEEIIDGACAVVSNVEPKVERPTCLVEIDDHFDGMASAPLQSPAEQSSNCMVRSQSLNSPLVRQHFTTSRLEPCMVRGESDPGNGPRNKRRHSGEGGALCHSSSSSSSTDNNTMFSDPLVNMEVCGARLSLREALFGIPGSTNLRRAIPKLRMIDTTPTPSDEELTQHSLIDGAIACEMPNGLCDSVPRCNEEAIEKTLIWTELEACKRQVSQVGVSACGATAVINVLQALEWPHSIEQVIDIVPTRQRSDREMVPKYLFSRSVAGTTHKDLIESVERISDGQIYGRFFHMYPTRKFNLTRWLRDWINLGAVPVATLNLQRGPVRPGQTIPDAWHHQMIFGVGPKSVYLTNPLESVSVSILSEQLSSPSELLVRRGDVTSRAPHVIGCVDPECDLSLLSQNSDERWDHFNVLGQVVNVLREEQALRRGSPGPISGKATQTSHIKIPAAYKSGITLFVPTSNEPCYIKLRSDPELPRLITVPVIQEPIVEKEQKPQKRPTGKSRISQKDKERR